MRHRKNERKLVRKLMMLTRSPSKDRGCMRPCEEQCKQMEGMLQHLMLCMLEQLPPCGAQAKSLLAVHRPEYELLAENLTHQALNRTSKDNSKAKLHMLSIVQNRWILHRCIASCLTLDPCMWVHCTLSNLLSSPPYLIAGATCSISTWKAARSISM